MRITVNLERTMAKNGWIGEFPSFIDIGHRRYTIRTFDRRESDNEKRRGVIDEWAHTIRIWEDMRPSDAAETLIHEVLHACWRNVPTSGDMEENVVEILAQNLAEVWRRNPHVIKWITKNVAA